MKIQTRSRSELRDYFRKNAVPTEGQFAELFSAMLNQRDDGLVKQGGSPLSIQAAGAGDNASDQQALHLYSNIENDAPDWIVSMNARSNPNDANTAKRGLNIGKTANDVKLFIDGATGNIGIGTNTPATKLQVQGDLTVVGLISYGNNASNTRTRDNAGLRGDAGAKSGFYETQAPAPAANWYPGASGWQHLLDVRHSNPGNNFALQIAGSFWNQELWYRKTSDNAAAGWNRFVYADPNNQVQIGSAASRSQLTITGNAGVLDLEGVDHSYIEFFPRGKASGRKSWMGYGSANTTELTIQNDEGIFTIRNQGGRMHIYGTELLYLLNRDGVIIGREWGGNGNLVVQGDVFARNSAIYFDRTDHSHSGYGNTSGYAAIENSGAPYNALMLLGRNINGAGSPIRRIVKVWDELYINVAQVTGSDARVKEDIEDLRYGLDEIRQLRPVSFNWIGKQNLHKSIGLIAQEVQPVMSELVWGTEDTTAATPLAVAYQSIIPVLINAVKELDAQVQQLKAERA